MGDAEQPEKGEQPQQPEVGDDWTRPHRIDPTPPQPDDGDDDGDPGQCMVDQIAAWSLRGSL
jgi:hypothetical protein